MEQHTCTYIHMCTGTYIHMDMCTYNKQVSRREKKENENQNSRHSWDPASATVRAASADLFA